MTDIPSAEEQYDRLTELLRELRIGPGHRNVMPYSALADGLGMSFSHWSRIVHGAYAPIRARGMWRTWDEFERDVRHAAAGIHVKSLYPEEWQDPIVSSEGDMNEEGSMSSVPE